MSRPDIPVTISGDPKGFESALARVRALSKSTATDGAGADRIGETSEPGEGDGDAEVDRADTNLRLAAQWIGRQHEKSLR